MKLIGETMTKKLLDENMIWKIYKTNANPTCSLTCLGGMRYRRVQFSNELWGQSEPWHTETGGIILQNKIKYTIMFKKTGRLWVKPWSRTAKS
jgi:hypothetical protein